MVRRSTMRQRLWPHRTASDILETFEVILVDQHWVRRWAAEYYVNLQHLSASGKGPPNRRSTQKEREFTIVTKPLSHGKFHSLSLDRLMITAKVFFKLFHGLSLKEIEGGAQIILGIEKEIKHLVADVTG